MNRIRKAVIPILSVLCFISALLMFFALNYSEKKQVNFIPPDFDSEAIIGVPEPPQELGWSEISQDGMSYRVGICGNIIINNGIADVYFFNSETNMVWLKLRVLDEQDNIICETGLIKPKEYIKSITFDEVKDGEKIKLKIMAYEPETYYSEGSITLNTNVEIGCSRYTDCSYNVNSLSNEMEYSFLTVRDINCKYIIVGG